MPNSDSPEKVITRPSPSVVTVGRSEEHTSELQSLTNLVCRLLLEKKKKNTLNHVYTTFFLYVPAPTEIYTLSLHDALPILHSWVQGRGPTGLIFLAPSRPDRVDLHRRIRYAEFGQPREGHHAAIAECRHRRKIGRAHV